MATNTVKVDLIGKDKNLSKTFKDAAKAGHTFSGMLKTVGKGLLFLGTVAIAAVVVALAAMIAFVIKAKGVYEGWMKTVAEMSRMTGLAAKNASKLAGQFELSGVEAKAGATGVFMFSKALDKARQGGKAQLEAFTRLHIALKDGEGRWKSLGTVLDQARDRLSGIKDAATRAGIGAALFGKGAKALLPWLVRSREEMAKYTSWLKQAGLLMGEKSVKQFKKYREDQKHMAILWKGFQVSAYRALVPLINQIMPSLIDGMKKVAGWMRGFADISMNKGIVAALREMVPGFKTVEKWARKAFQYIKEQWPKAVAWWEENGPGITEGLVAFGRGFIAVSKAVGRASAWLSRNKTVVGAVRKAFELMNPALAYGMWMFRNIGKVISTVISVGRRVIGVIKDIATVVWTVTSGGFSSLLGSIQWVIDKARTAYEWIRKVLGSQGNMSGGGGKGGGGGGFGIGPATGGITTGPLSGYAATLHGTELVIPLNGNRYTPNRVYDYGGSNGPAPGGQNITIQVVLPGGTALIGEAERVGAALAPHVARALGRETARTGRRR